MVKDERRVDEAARSPHESQHVDFFKEINVEQPSEVPEWTCVKKREAVDGRRNRSGRSGSTTS